MKHVTAELRNAITPVALVAQELDGEAQALLLGAVGSVVRIADRLEREAILRPPVFRDTFCTHEVVRALREAGNLVTFASCKLPLDIFDIELRRPPRYIKVRVFQSGALAFIALHTSCQMNPYENSIPSTNAERGQWVPCPKCGSALLKHENDFSEHRICLEGHRVVLTGDWHTAALKESTEDSRDTSNGEARP